jgi:hypothetical protein
MHDEIGYCPNCNYAIPWSSPMDTVVCRGCGEWWHTEFLLRRPR